MISKDYFLENLPLKTFMIHKFVEKYCQSSEWIFVHDDDTFINYRKQLELIENLNQKDHFQCMFGYLTEEAPLRWAKYNVSATQWPIGYRYPKFCHGPCMTLTRYLK